jgi:cytoskeleton-associated protein 5
MQLNKVMLEAHQFFCDFPGDTWRDKPSDMPLRTVKTVLNAITKAKGDAVSILKFFIHSSCAQCIFSDS